MRLEAVARALSSSYLRLGFQMSPRLAEAWRELLAAHEALSGSLRIWDVASAVGSDRDRTHTAAILILRRRRMHAGHARTLDDVIATSETAPRFVSATGPVLDIYPGLCMVQTGQNFDLVSLLDIEVGFAARQFIEPGTVPVDSKVASAWLGSRVAGGGSKRLAAYRPVPLAVYGELSLTSGSSLHAAYMFSNADAALRFALALQDMKDAQRAMDAPAAGVGTEAGEDAATDGFEVAIPVPAPAPRLLGFAIIGLVLLVGVGMLYGTGARMFHPLQLAAPANAPLPSLIRPPPQSPPPPPAAAVATLPPPDTPPRKPLAQSPPPAATSIPPTPPQGSLEEPPASPPAASVAALSPPDTPPEEPLPEPPAAAIAGPASSPASSAPPPPIAPAPPLPNVITPASPPVWPAETPPGSTAPPARAVPKEAPPRSLPGAVEPGRETPVAVLTPEAPKPANPAAPNSQAVHPTVTVMIFANIRMSGEAGAPIVRVANPGEKLAVFGSAFDWFQVGPIGSDAPIGWIWGAVVRQN